jgi:hypothetical protein
VAGLLIALKRAVPLPRLLLYVIITECEQLDSAIIFAFSSKASVQTNGTLKIVARIAKKNPIADNHR